MNSTLFSTFFLLWRNRVVPMRSPRVAFWNSFGSQPKPFKWPMYFQCLNSILGTGWIMPARCRGKWRNPVFINVNRNQKNPTQKFHYCFYNTLHAFISGTKLQLIFNVAFIGLNETIIPKAFQDAWYKKPTRTLYVFVHKVRYLRYACHKDSHLQE